MYSSWLRSRVLTCFFIRLLVILSLVSDLVWDCCSGACGLLGPDSWKADLVVAFSPFSSLDSSSNSLLETDKIDDGFGCLKPPLAHLCLLACLCLPAQLCFFIHLHVFALPGYCHLFVLLAHFHLLGHLHLLAHYHLLALVANQRVAWLNHLGQVYL